MTVQRKLLLVLISVFSLIISALAVLSIIRHLYIENQSRELNQKIQKQIEVELEKNLIDMSQGLTHSLTSIIDEKKRTLISAANTVQTIESENSFDILSLRELAYNIGIDEIQFADEKGKIILATDSEEQGKNLFTDERLELILDAGVSVLPSDLYYDTSKEALYLGTAVPKKNELGLINVVAEVEEIEMTINDYVSSLKGFKGIQLIGKSGEVLISIDEEPSKEKVTGTVSQDRFVERVFLNESEFLHTEDGVAYIYFPVEMLGTVHYVLKMDLELEPYMVVSRINKNGIDEIQNMLNIMTNIGFAVLFITFVLGVIVLIITITKMLKPLNEIVGVIEEVSKGNLSISHNVKSKDEIGQLMSSFNLMVKDLRNMTLDIRNSADELQERTKEINTSIITVAEVNNEINFSIDNMAIGAVSQVEESSEAVDEARELSKNLTFMRNSIEEMEQMMQEIAKEIDGVNKIIGIGNDNGSEHFDMLGNVSTSIHQLVNGTMIMNREVDQILKIRTNVLMAVENISTISEESASFIEEVNASVEEQNQEVNNMVSIVGELNDMAIRLVELVDRYTL